MLLVLVWFCFLGQIVDTIMISLKVNETLVGLWGFTNFVISVTFIATYDGISGAVRQNTFTKTNYSLESRLDLNGQVF